MNIVFVWGLQEVAFLVLMAIVFVWSVVALLKSLFGRKKK